jgi:hypothetical protein
VPAVLRKCLRYKYSVARWRVSLVTVWIYVNTAKEVGDEDHLKVFASEEAAERWFAEHDPEGVAVEYAVLE